MTLAVKRLIVSAACVVALAGGGAARADDLYMRSGSQGAELQLKNVTIKGVKDGELYYNVNGRESHRPVADVSRLEVAGDAAFNAAEKAFAEARVAKDEAVAKAKFAEAVGGYTQTMGSTNKPWMKDYAALRMQVAAPRSGRFDAALDGWRAMVEKDPAAAAKAKPPLDGIDPKSQYLANGAKALQTWAGGAQKPEAQRVYLEMLGDVQTAMGDTEGAAKTLDRRITLGGTPQEVADALRGLALNDLANKRYDAAAERVGKIDAAGLDDAGRADVAYVLAECRAVKLPPTAPADQWRDLAIEYMKVVVGAPQSANAGAALLKVAEIHETIKDPETALKVYQQVAREHANTPAGEAAQRGADRLGKGAARG
jgi:tetratricopeptide (TPR) repeat protein